MKRMQLHFLRFRRWLLIAGISLAAAACDPGTQLAWITGTSIVSGTITGFGSVFVNGVEYDISQSEFIIDGQTGFASVADAQNRLALGMVVRLENARDNGDGTGVAGRVIYDDVVQGPMTAPALVNNDPNRKQFSVLGRPVIADQFSTVFDRMSYADLARDRVVEVSGFTDANGVIRATRIESKGTLAAGMNIVELHGQVSALNLSSGAFLLGQKVQQGQTVSTPVFFDVQNPPLVRLPNGLQDGLHVEVKGRYQSDGSVVADRIEGEDAELQRLQQAPGDVEMQGIVANFVSASNFTVNGLPVDASGLPAADQAALGNGVQVEVQGVMVNQVLVARRVELRGAEAEIKARLVTVDTAAGFIEVRFPGSSRLKVLVDAKSLLKDERTGGGSGRVLKLADLAADLSASSVGYLDIQVTLRRSGADWRLVTLKREDPFHEYEAKGVVEGADSTPPGSLTLYGLTLPLDPNAQIQPGFFTNLNAGVTRVELQDTDQDGDFDQASISVAD